MVTLNDALMELVDAKLVEPQGGVHEVGREGRLRRGAQGEAARHVLPRGMMLAPGPGAGSRQPAGHRQHRLRRPHRAELRHRAHAAGQSGGVRSLSHRGHRPQFGGLRGDASRSCRTLEAAVADCVSVAVLTARARTAKRRTLRPRAAAAELVEQATRGPVAIVAGREDRGLTNAELDLGHLLVTIPTDPRNSSLNLAQAIAIMAYETFLARGGESMPLKPHRKRAEPGDGGTAGGAVRRLAPGAVGDRLLQDPAFGQRDALLPGDPASGGARRTGIGPGPGDGHRGRALSRVGSARRWQVHRRPKQGDGHEPIERLLGRQSLSRRVRRAASRTHRSRICPRRWPPASGPSAKGSSSFPKSARPCASWAPPGAGPGSTESETGRSAGCTSSGTRSRPPSP